jgi:hypothetical protein
VSAANIDGFTLDTSTLQLFWNGVLLPWLCTVERRFYKLWSIQVPDLWCCTVSKSGWVPPVLIDITCTENIQPWDGKPSMSLLPWLYYFSALSTCTYCTKFLFFHTHWIYIYFQHEPLQVNECGKESVLR